MASYVVLIDYTEQGMRQIEATVERADALRTAASALGAEVKEVFWTTGGHDGVLILDAPDEATVAALVLGLGRGGNVRTTTLRAFDRAEIQAVLGKLA